MKCDILNMGLTLIIYGNFYVGISGCYTAKRLRHYMVNHTTWLISEMDPIKYIFEKPSLARRIARWQMLLSKYDIEYRSQKAIKGSILADHLAHQQIEDYQPIKVNFLDEEIMYLKMKDCDEPLFGKVQILNQDGV